MFIFRLLNFSIQKFIYARSHIIFKMPNVMSVPVKLSIVSASVGIALIGALAMYFRRRKKRPKNRSGNNSNDAEAASTKFSTMNHRSNRNTFASNHPYRHSNGDVPDSRRSLSPTYRGISRSGSQASLRSDASTVLANTTKEHAELNPEQLCAIGLEELDHAIKHWEGALTQIEDSADLDSLDPSMYQLSEQLHLLLERGYRMKEHFEQRMFKTVQSNAALDAAIQEMDKEYEKRRKRTGSISEASSDLESFVSALDLADLTDLHDQRETHQHLALYDAALLEITHGSVPCRALRTKWMHCESDTEFLAKLHCIRLAFHDLFKDETIREWFVSNGKQMVGNLMIRAERDPEDFRVAYDDMIDWVKNPENLPTMEEELRGRGVKLISFYDVVIDFILFDAFEDLESPPSSVKTVVQNRWLSNGFKETALSTACWSVLKAKRRLLKFKNGFIAHFYVISEQTSPLLAWGFLGPPGELRDMCEFFKDQVMGLMRDVFSFDKARYTTVEHLSDDIMRLCRQRMAVIDDRLG